MPDGGTYALDTETVTETETESYTDSNSASDSESTSDVDCTAVAPCSENGRCVSTDTGAVCECDAGWAGTTCDECAAGWHDEKGECELDEKCLETSCAFHEVDGGCSVDDGVVVCDCEGKWDDKNHCATCLPGFHEENDECVEDVYCLDGTRPCMNSARCSEEAGRIVCDCSVSGTTSAGNNWIGELCEICPEGYHVDGKNCLKNETCTASACGDNGQCVVTVEGSAICVCSTGWTHENSSDAFSDCSECANGYHHPDGDATVCVLDEECAATTCGDGTCFENTSGTVFCVCPFGSHLDADTFCEECVSGYHWDAGIGCVEDDDSCLVLNPCGDHGTCRYVDGVKSCECDALYTGATCSACVSGYQDENGDGECQPDCDTAALQGMNCGDNGDCGVNVFSGLAECECDRGYAGADCAGCASGFHWDYTLDVCLENDQCVQDGVNSSDCSGNGTCVDNSGVVVCECNVGWTGTACDVCAAGYHPSGSSCVINTTCTQDGANSADCNGNGSCDDSSGAPVCICENGWTGTNCDACATDYHLFSGNCVLNEQCVATSCSGNGSCQIVDGLVDCDCTAGYTGTYCDLCATGFHLDVVSGNCVTNEACVDTSVPSADCNSNGTCNDTTGLVICECNAGWTGITCEVCASGYHFNGSSCVADSVCNQDGADSADCSGNGSCDDSSGVPVCTCETGWMGTSCDTCATDYHLFSGDCVLNEQCLATSCSGNGSCLIVDGLVDCNCASGYTGTYCDQCAVGFHIDFLSGNCVANEVCVDTSDPSADCSSHGACNDTTGLVSCECDAGFAGDDCSVCANGYHMESGNCVVDTVCTASSCANGGACTVVNNAISCTCTGNWDPATYCATCASGYHQVGSTCVVDETCTASSCNYGGTCSIVGGVVSCSCNSGFTGDYCEYCTDDIYEENDNDSEAVLITNGFDAVQLVSCLDLDSPSPGTSDPDVFEFDITEASTIDAIITFNGAAADLDLYLWEGSIDHSSWTTLVDASEDIGTSSESITYFVSSADVGTYYLEILNWDKRIRASYEIDVIITPMADSDSATDTDSDTGTDVDTDTCDPLPASCAAAGVECGTHCGGNLVCGETCGAGESCYEGICGTSPCVVSSGSFNCCRSDDVSIVLCDGGVAIYDGTCGAGNVCGQVGSIWKCTTTPDNQDVHCAEPMY